MQTINSARNFFEFAHFKRFQLPAITFCKICEAKKFIRELPSICCANRKVTLAKVDIPKDLNDLFLRNDKTRIEFDKIFGDIYHAIPDFLPDDNSLRFLQLYVYDTEHADINRLKIMSSLHQNMISQIRRILNDVNPFVINFYCLSEICNLSCCKLIIKANSGLDQHIYNSLMASQVATI
ncbi:2311_t:CDS:2 [Diversispora eburnea]|uniref:2311_t:CDS:1 n=1 Tax=Diversispora eburnea TaxID=1213867 RepID=A0A9N9BLG7_9GLOM|nr:2311_t:CDS:2 [Diversispora eburnea]